MKTIEIKKGLDLPISGAPDQMIRTTNEVRRVALIGDDYIGMKPTMLVSPGDKVVGGQKVFTDKKNDGVVFTSPGCGTVIAVNRGAKRKFESLVISLEGDEVVTYCDPVESPESITSERIRELLIESGLWTIIRTRPYGKNPPVDASPASLFITVSDSEPLAADPLVIIREEKEKFTFGLKILRQFLEVPIHYCVGSRELEDWEQVDGIDYWSFSGPHPAGLASTHIHYIDPVHETKFVWHIGYQDVIAIGHLFMTGQPLFNRTIALSGTGFIKPGLVKTRIGALLPDLCRRELTLDDLRIISGSVLSGREATSNYNFLGRFHNQISAILDSSGRSFFNWLLPGRDRFSTKPVFASAFMDKTRKFAMNTAMWGGRRAIYPLGTYDKVMPMDIIATSLLKSVSKGDTEKSKALGCLELIEEDLGLCGFVCPGKNEFGPDLREVLTAIEQGG